MKPDELVAVILYLLVIGYVFFVAFWSAGAFK